MAWCHAPSLTGVAVVASALRPPYPAKAHHRTDPPVQEKEVAVFGPRTMAADQRSLGSEVADGCLEPGRDGEEGVGQGQNIAEMDGTSEAGIQGKCRTCDIGVREGRSGRQGAGLFPLRIGGSRARPFLEAPVGEGDPTCRRGYLPVTKEGESQRKPNENGPEASKTSTHLGGRQRCRERLHWTVALNYARC